MRWKDRCCNGRAFNAIAILILHIVVIGWFIFLSDVVENPPAVPRDENQIFFGRKYSTAEEALARMSPETQSSVKDIQVNDFCEHMGPGIVGVCHSDGRICLKSNPGMDKDYVVWHEGGHAVTMRNTNLKKRYLAIPASPVTSYGYRSVDEDMAEWIANFHMSVDGRKSAFDGIGSYDKDLNLERADVFRDSGAITDSDYQIFYRKMRR